MYRKYLLKPQTVHGTDLEFEWDPETGDVRGPGAVLVRELAAEARARGYTTGHPYPTYHETRDPLRSEAEMAVVLGQYWRLAGDLQAAYPAGSGEDLPEGAIA